MRNALERKEDQEGCIACAAAKAESGRFEGYASLFNLRDRSGDVVKPGAFRRTLAAKRTSDIRLLHQHKAEEPIGIWEEVAEDARGLFVRGRLILSAPRAYEAWVLLKEGAIDGLSIGYKTVRAGRTAKSQGRTLFDIDLWEISLVTFPLLTGARVMRLEGEAWGSNGSGVTLTSALRNAALRMSP
ncbi:HK97 family phage prohead protease [bacterium AH-315-P15]|nr:HK97 family phage prohead protease [bacterium AH-315-P15]